MTEFVKKKLNVVIPYAERNYIINVRNDTNI